MWATRPLGVKITVEFPSVIGEERKTLGDRSLYQVEVAVCSLIWMLRVGMLNGTLRV